MIFIFLFAVFFFSENPKTADLEVRVTSIEQPNNGVLYVSLYNSEQTFLDENAIYKSQILKKYDVAATVIFSDLPEGKYAVAIFQDKNENGRIDKNFLGIPTEPFGFSNMKRFGIPKWEKVHFAHNAQSQKREVVMVNQ